MNLDRLPNLMQLLESDLSGEKIARHYKERWNISVSKTHINRVRQELGMQRKHGRKDVWPMDDQERDMIRLAKYFPSRRTVVDSN